ncbi:MULTISPECIES: helix-turn-helix domain-containing protein [unclassified Lebetimonas]|uniref:helix-turn-helix domain-containing protein n=1 Tax=unclassified Lebetimonas TaxID=2648158 RepID=UPI000466334C|nr:MULTISPECIES: helix-turn-helix domain-containing protein [unclassified Lebetimonas]
MSCIYCNHYILYKLKNGYYKCAKCKRKFSPKKIERKAKILKGFLDELNPTEIAEKYNISYATVVKEIQNIRKIVVNICEEEFLKKQDLKEFNEYLYIPKTNRKNKNSIYKAQNFLTIDYGGKIYNILLSDMQKYKNLSYEEIKSLLRQSQLIKIQKQILIYQFWEYFETFITKYKGIKEKNFIYYLKEAEFRFNNFKLSVSELVNYEIHL